MAGLDLDLDLELELDPAFDFTKPTTEPQAHTSGQTESIVQLSTSIHHYEGLKLDPSLPLFFPRPDDPHSRDIVTFAKDQGWQFYRTDDSYVNALPPLYVAYFRYIFFQRNDSQAMGRIKGRTDA